MIETIVIIVLTLLTAFFAGSETAFIMVNKLKVEIKARKKNRMAQNARYFARHPERFYSTILLGTNIVGLTFAAVCTIFFTRIADLSELEIGLISTAILLIFGEILPKYISRENPDHILAFSVTPLRVISILLRPVIKFTSWLAILITGQRRLDAHAFSNYFDREDIQELIEESEKAGSVTKNESDIIANVLQLKQMRVSEVMRPRTEVIGVDMESTIEEVRKTFIESGFSRLPVYRDNLDHITGIVPVNDFFKDPHSLKEITRPVLYVPEARKSIDMLNDFVNQEISFAVVVDEFGGTAGIVTMEDILEELYGEIKDEYDIEEDICRMVNDHTFIINGKIEIDYINEQFKLGLPKGEYETISGLITSFIGRIPAKDEEIVKDHFVFHIIRSSNVKVEMVKLIVRND